MPDLRRYAAVLVAALFLAAPMSALAQDPTPTPAEQPPLSEEPPEGFGEGEEEGEEPAEEPAPEESAGGREESDEQLPDTGLEAGLVALLGLGLLASGSGLHVTLRRGA